MADPVLQKLLKLEDAGSVLTDMKPEGLDALIGMMDMENPIHRQLYEAVASTAHTRHFLDTVIALVRSSEGAV